jgi:four helix bundle protein
MREKITRFEDMTVWQDSQTFAVRVYKLTKTFPKDELYGLTSQMRRASSSISANIAEGFGRNSQKDKAHFYHIALGSLLETKNFIYLGAKLDYIEKEEVTKLIEITESVHNQINAILKYFRNND